MLGWLKKDDVIPEIITSGEEGRWRAISKRLAVSRLPRLKLIFQAFFGESSMWLFLYKLSQMSRTPRADSRHFPQIARPERAVWLSQPEHVSVTACRLFFSSAISRHYP